MTPPLEPVLTPEERQLFDKGVNQFNSGYYFECHDTLEDLWSGLRGPTRDFFQGLIQVSVGFYHLNSGNLAGAQSMFERALRRFQSYPDSYFGFDLGKQRQEIVAWQKRLSERPSEPITGPSPPRWTFEPR